MILHKDTATHRSQCQEAFVSSITVSDEELVTIVAGDSSVQVDPTTLAIHSPFVRQLLASLPCCARKTIVMTEFSSASICQFFKLIGDGYVQGPEQCDYRDIITIVKTFDIDPSHITINDPQLSNEGIVYREKDSLQLCSTPLVQTKKEKQSPDTTMTDFDQLLNSSADIERFLSMEEQSINIPSASEFQEVAYTDNVQDKLSADGGSNSRPGDKDHDKGGADLECQLCGQSHQVRSQLLTHYVLNHYMSDLHGELRHFATDKKCNLCGKECKTKQQLCLHLGVKHKKVNTILLRHGLREHTKPGAADSLRTEATESKPSSPLNKTKDASREIPTDGKNVCQICSKSFDGLGILWQHYVSSHFSKLLKENYASCMDLDNLKCLICGKILRQKQGLLGHVGTFHLKVNELLRQEGYKELEVREAKKGKLSISMLQMTETE